MESQPVLESDLKKIVVAQLHLMLDLMITIGTLNAVLADQGVLPLEKMKEARRIVENLPKVATLRKQLAEIQDSSSIVDILENFQGTIQ
jgi:hypothetical protein